jgi:predicted O-methyltransferase YrrM
MRTILSHFTPTFPENCFPKITFFIQIRHPIKTLEDIWLNVDYYGNTLNNLQSIIENIKIIKNDSLSESKNYDDEYFDIVYIDASHEYHPVKNDILSWLPKVKKGGIICGDDYTAGWPGVVQAVNEIFENNVNKVGHQQWWVKK